MMSFGHLGGSRGEDVLRRHCKDYRKQTVPTEKDCAPGLWEGRLRRKVVEDDLSKSGDM